MTVIESCNCPCACPRTGQRDDDGTPGWCDPCRMSIHQPWECPRCHCLFERPGFKHEPCWTAPRTGGSVSEPESSSEEGER